MNPWMIDAAILIILALAIFFGYRRGLILTAFSLVSVIVALVGALLLTSIFAPIVTKAIEPKIAEKIRPTVEEALPQDALQTTSDLHKLVERLQEKELPFGLNDQLDEINIPSLDPKTAVDDITAALAHVPAAAISYCVVGLVSFVLVLLAWKLLAKLLNWVAKLPGLNVLNRTGGVLIGLAEALLLIVALVWLLRYTGVLRDADVDESLLLPWVLKIFTWL